MKNESKINNDKLISSFFFVFDNREGKIPEFSELEKLISPDAVIYKRNGNSIEKMSLEEFWKPREEILTNGTLTEFYEWETESQTSIFSGIASRISSYKKEGLFNGEPYSGEGIKHFQLLLSNDKWKIVSIIWEDK